MKALRTFSLAVTLATGLLGCGATVGDACTTDADCGSQSICINNRDYTPGGYCSQPCAPNNDRTCPSGSTCVSRIAGDDVSACLLQCARSDECRSGYLCLNGVRNNPNFVCVGAQFK